MFGMSIGEARQRHGSAAGDSNERTLAVWLNKSDDDAWYIAVGLLILWFEDPVYLPAAAAAPADTRPFLRL
jgi:hypothetical protein